MIDQAITLPRIRLFLEWLVILAFSLGVTAWAVTYDTTGRLDLQLLDRITASMASPASDEIVIVAIDDRSLAELGQWPWDRRKLAQLIDRLDTAGVRLIELDVLFTEPSAPDADAALAAAMRRSGKVALPYSFTQAEGRTSGMDALKPLPDLASASAFIGHVALQPDADGVIRRVSLVGNDGARDHLHMQLLASRALPGWSGKLPPFTTDFQTTPVLPLRPAGSYRTMPLASVLRGEVPPAFLSGKVALVGATASGLGDIHAVPARSGSLMSGIELQANLLQTLRENSFVHPLSASPRLWLAMLPVALLFLGFWRLRPAWCLALVTVLAVGQLTASLILATIHHRWLPPGPALLGMTIAYPLWGWRRLDAVSHFLLERSRRLTRAGTGSAVTLGGFDSVARQVSRLDFLVDEVSERRDFLQRVLEATPDAMCTFDRDDRLLLMNGRASELFGEQVSEVTFPAMLHAIGARQFSDGREIETEDGRTFSLARSSGGPSANWDEIRIIVLSDITEARRAEEERRHMLEFLSHDMRSPQVAILSLASLESGRDDEKPARLERIRNHARRTLELADNFVQLARLDEAALAFDLIDMNMLAEEAADRAHSSARQRGIILTVVIGEDPALLQGDGMVLSRLIDNLVGNAIKYCPEGSTVRITVSCDGNPVGPDSKVTLEIADNGPGLPEERGEDPFRRFGGTNGGAGLGLAFVAAAVKRHQGEVTCISVPGQGTRFIVRLPGGSLYSAELISPE